MSAADDFSEILMYAHTWNWAPDWEIARKVYASFPDSFSVLTPFAYAYLEEMIRSTTSEYGTDAPSASPGSGRRAVGARLIEIAIQENRNEPELTHALNKLRPYFLAASTSDRGDNRHSTVHGFMHPRYWTKESFEKLIHDIAGFSKHARF